MITGLLPGVAKMRDYYLNSPDAVGYGYVFGLSALQLGLGYLAVGLIKPWGSELFGRRIPTALVVTLGVIGSLLLILIFTIWMPYGVLATPKEDGLAQFIDGGPLILMVACYIPLLVWGPLLLAAVYGYWRRRRTERSVPTVDPATAD